jgi:phosphate uptake regulator
MGELRSLKTTMIRKVIKQAGQAYTITLPIEWVRENNIAKHPEVNLSVQDKSIIVSNTHEVSIRRASLKIDNSDRFLLGRRIQALYAKGIDEIEIISKDDISSEIVDILTEVIGYALVSQNKNTYIVKDIGGGNYSDLDEIFKRVFQMVLMFYDSAINDMFGKEVQTKDGLNSRDMEINKFCFFLERAINKMSYSDPIKGRILFTYSFSLEKIGDEIHRLWRTNLTSEIKKTDKLKDLLLLSKEALDLTFDFYYSNDLSLLEKIYKLKLKIRRDAESLTKQESFDFARHAIKIVEDASDLNHLSLIGQ